MKLYKGMNKRQYKKCVGRYTFKIIMNQRDVKVGDVRSECDGFNHVVSDIDIYKTRTSGGWYVEGFDFYFDEGKRMFCNCPIGCGPPETKEEIEAYWASHTDEDIEHLRAGGWNVEDTIANRDLARRRELVDERGLKL